MNQIINKETVLAVIGTFVDLNAGDEATEELLYAIGAELLGVSVDTFIELI